MSSPNWLFNLFRAKLKIGCNFVGPKFLIVCQIFLYSRPPPLLLDFHGIHNFNAIWSFKFTLSCWLRRGIWRSHSLPTGVHRASVVFVRFRKRITNNFGAILWRVYSAQRNQKRKNEKSENSTQISVRQNENDLPFRTFLTTQHHLSRLFPPFPIKMFQYLQLPLYHQFQMFPPPQWHQ